MGSYAVTCVVSNLPIERGDEVRWLLVAQSPYSDDNLKCSINGEYFPRTIPIKAIYNDYGSIEKAESGVLRKAILESFKIDLIEQGWGENSCHDVPTSKTMSFEALLKALWECRVLVDSNTNDTSYFYGKAKSSLSLAEKAEKLEEADRKEQDALPVEIPTLNRVRNALHKAGLRLKEDHEPRIPVPSPPFMVDDDEGYGKIRVREASYSSFDNLDKVKKCLEEAGYAVLLVANEGGFRGGGDLLVRPKPIKDGHVSPYGISLKNREASRVLKVQQAMIREDVYQALLRLKIEDDYGGATKGAALKWHVKRMRDMWAAGAKQDKLIASIEKLSGKDQIDAIMAVDYSIFQNEVPCSLGTGTFFKIVRKLISGDEERVVDAILKRFAEFYFISNTLSATRYQWHPTNCNGPQFGLWRAHADLLSSLQELAEEKAQQQEDEEKEHLSEL